MSAVAEQAPVKTVALAQVGEVAPVVKSGIKNSANTASDGTVDKYCAAIVAGKPSGKLFPAKLSEMEFTPEQREAIRGARAEHKLNCMNAKKQLLGIVRSKAIETVGHRTNRDESMGTIRYAKRERVTHAFIYGAEPKRG